MAAHFASQIRQKTIRTPNAVAGPARQYGYGGLGALAMRMGRMAMPLVKHYLILWQKNLEGTYYRYLYRKSRTSSRVGKDQRLCWGKS